MKLLALEQDLPGITSEMYKPYLKEEARRAWELYREGIFREIYFDKNSHNAVIIMECRDVVEAETALQSLPLVQKKLIAFEVMPLEPYSGFARLFAEK